MQLPAIDQNICGQWTQRQKDAYQKLDHYLMEAQTQYRKEWVIWPKLFTPPVRWKPNMGETMRRVATEPSPLLRQEAFPEVIQTDPTTDVINVRERFVDTKLRRKRFRSPDLHFLPSFQDFMDHVDDCSKNINRQMTLFEDIFYRSHAFHHAPAVWVCGVGLVDAPIGDGNLAGTTGKDNAWVQAQVTATMGVQGGELSMEELFTVLNAAEQIQGMTPFEGTGMPGGDSNPLNQKFCLVTSGERWNNYVNDPWLKENRTLNMNIVTDRFYGDLWGRIRAKLERYPLRYGVDNNGVISKPAPETIEENPDREAEFGRTKPNPVWGRVSSAQVEVAFLVGGPSFNAVESGAPPSAFSGRLSEEAVRGMNWNGKPYITKDFLVPCTDADGTVHWETNGSWSEYLRIQAQFCGAVSGINSFNVLPIFHKRVVGVNTSVQ